jgi:two-component system, OmpR family, response regulator MprA
MTANAWVLEALLDSPRHVLEIGCGEGELALALAAAGHDVVAIDLDAPAGGVFRRVALEEFEASAPFDAVVASLSLHHIADVEAAVGKVAAMLVPEGRFVVNEFAWERLDRRAAGWAADRIGGEARDLAAQWEREHRDLHTGAAVLAALERRFDRLRFGWVPYIARMLRQPEAEADEARAIAAGEVGPVGFRWIGRPRAAWGYPRIVAAASILVVDDDAPIRRMLQRTLAAEGHDVSAAADGGAALAAVERAVPDLLVLDVAMPGLDGFAVCRRLRAKGLGLPILLLTARDAVPDRVAGLDAGADDYLVKPFATEELVARVRALLRRGLEPAQVLAHGDVVLDLTSRTARRRGRDLALSARELDLLELLLRNARQVVTRELALELVWGGVAAASPNVVDRYVSYLRRKLGEPGLIDTVRGTGFVLRA